MPTATATISKQKLTNQLQTTNIQFDERLQKQSATK
jgi:hypothetical protein